MTDNRIDNPDSRGVAQETGDWLSCPSCGYRLVGLDRPMCPECGLRVEVAPASEITTQRWTWILVAAGLAAILAAFVETIIRGGVVAAVVVPPAVGRHLANCALFAALGAGLLAGRVGMLRADFALFPLVAIVALAGAQIFEMLPWLTGPPSGIDWGHAIWTLQTVVTLGCVAGIGMMLPTNAEQVHRFSWLRTDVGFLALAGLMTLLLLVSADATWGTLDLHDWMHRHSPAILWPVVMWQCRRADAQHGT